MSKLSIYAVLAACLLSTPFMFKTAMADVPPAPASAAPQATRIVLQHIVPSDILTMLHWDHAGTLPAGVSSVTAQPSGNALSVVATPAGLAKVREIVTILDIEPRQVQIKSALAAATDAQLEASGIDFDLVPVDELKSDAGSAPDFIQYATGKPVAALLAFLTKSGSILQQPVVTTTNNTEASLSISSRLPGEKREGSRFQVTPRVNSDNSVTMSLDVSVARNVVAEETASLELKTLRTVKDGETMVMGRKTASGDTFLLFVTPTIVPLK